MQDIGEQSCEMIFRFSKEVFQRLMSKRQSDILCEMQEKLRCSQSELATEREINRGLGASSIRVSTPEKLQEYEQKLNDAGVSFNVHENDDLGYVELVYAAKDEQAVKAAMTNALVETLQEEAPELTILGPDSDLPDPELAHVDGLDLETVKTFSEPGKYYVDIESAEKQWVQSFDSYTFLGKNNDICRLGPYDSKEAAQAAKDIVTKDSNFLKSKDQHASRLHNAKSEKKILDHQQDKEVKPQTKTVPSKTKEPFADREKRAKAAVKSKLGKRSTDKKHVKAPVR